MASYYAPCICAPACLLSTAYSFIASCLEPAATCLTQAYACTALPRAYLHSKFARITWCDVLLLICVGCLTHALTLGADCCDGCHPVSAGCIAGGSCTQEAGCIVVSVYKPVSVLLRPSATCCAAPCDSGLCALVVHWRLLEHQSWQSFLGSLGAAKDISRHGWLFG